MTPKDHNIAVTLNERLESLMNDLNSQYSEDLDLLEVNRDFARISAFLTKQILKTFDDEMDKD